jgi:hypothetical protein
MMTVVMLRTLPMLDIEPSTFCAICVSISVGSRAGLGMLTFDQGEGDVGIQVDGQPDEGDHAQEEQHDEQHDRRDRMADRPRGNVSSRAARCILSAPA